jgi:polygalacturonase
MQIVPGSVRRQLLVLAALGCASLLSRAVRAQGAAPIKPPLPQIPAHSFTLTDFGAVGDGKTMNTEAFKKALHAVQEAGGGKLVVPKGEYLTLPLNLVSHLDLHLEEGATIQFPADLAAYSAMEPLLPRPPSVANMDGGNGSLFFGDKLTDVAITGAGTIDGGGQAWWNRNGAPGRGGRGARGGATQPGATGTPPARGQAFAGATPPATRGAAGRGRGRVLAQTGQIFGRPKMVILTDCQRVYLEGVTLNNSPMWNFVPVMCTDVTIENVKVNAPQRSPNTDALNPTACTNVLIRNCDLSVGDDNIALKALGGPNSNIWIENVHSKFGHGISIGSETYGGVHDVTVLNCTFDGGDNGIRIKSARDRGNQLYNFTFSNITIDHVLNPILITMYYAGSRERQMQEVTPTTPFLKNVKISNVTIKNARNAGSILGLPEAPATNVVLTNVDIEAQTGMTVQDVKGCVFDNVKIKVQSGEPIIQSFADLTIK